MSVHNTRKPTGCERDLFPPCLLYLRIHIHSYFLLFSFYFSFSFFFSVFHIWFLCFAQTNLKKERSLNLCSLVPSLFVYASLVNLFSVYKKWSRKGELLWYNFYFMFEKKKKNIFSDLFLYHFEFQNIIDVIFILYIKESVYLFMYIF